MPDKRIVKIYEVIPNKRKKLIADSVNIVLFGVQIWVISEDYKQNFRFEDTTAITVLGRNKANIYHKGKIYQLKGEKGFNALKYVHFYNRFMNLTRGDGNGKFLGL